MINLTEYNNSELYDHVQNDEYLYNECEPIEDENGIIEFISQLEGIFIFNDDQKNYLENEIRETFLTFEVIIDSYVNGNKKQFLSQIEEFGRYDFILELEHLDDEKLKNKIAFFILKNWS
jgi:hypothetical protein